MEECGSVPPRSVSDGMASAGKHRGSSPSPDRPVISNQLGGKEALQKQKKTKTLNPRNPKPYKPQTLKILNRENPKP